MATESNNILTNLFVKGMNSDTSYDMVENSLYVFGLNIRITTNSLLKSISDSNSNEGIITPVNAGKDVQCDDIYTGHYRILATGSIENVGVVIIAKDRKWYVYRVDFADRLKFSLLFESEEQSNIKPRFSIVMNREMNNVVKVYIADGIHLIMLINLLDDTYNKIISGNTDNITSNRIYPSIQARIDKLISGQLKTSLVQYTYRLYKKYGISSRLAPLTNKILIIDSNRNKEEGNALDTTTSMGLLISIPIENLNIKKDLFDHVQVFRLSYVNPQEDANVDLIYDSFIKDDNIVIRDSGGPSLKTLNIEELSSMNSMILVPQNLELNLNYMFMSNIEDNTILRIDKDNINIDSKTYRKNASGKYYLRSNKDPFNSENHIEVTSLNDIQDDYDVNVLSIMSDLNTVDNDSKYIKHDDTYYYGGDGLNINWKFVTTPIVVHDQFNIYSPSVPYSTGNKQAEDLFWIKKGGDYTKIGLNTDDYLKQHGIAAMKSLEYDDIIGSSMFRSLRRDEVYRYGIVYYDKYGKRSDVQWIGDIRTPAAHECKPFAALEIVIDEMLSVKEKISIEGETTCTKRVFNEDTLLFNTEGVIANKQIDTRGGSSIKTSIDSITISSGDKLYELEELIKLLPYPDRWSVTCKIIVDDVEYQIGDTIELSHDSSINVQLNPLSANNVIPASNEAWYNFTQLFGENTAIVKFTTTVNITVERLLSSDSIANLMSYPLGILFNINVPKNSNITSYQIVRCSKQSEFSQTVMLCAMTRPMHQQFSATATSDLLKSPYYPTPFMSSQYFKTFDYLNRDCSNEDNNHLFLVHASEISIFPEDSASLVHKNDSRLKYISFSYEGALDNIALGLNGYKKFNDKIFNAINGLVYYNRDEQYGSGITVMYDGNGNPKDWETLEASIEFKESASCNMYLYKQDYSNPVLNAKMSIIEEVSQVQVPTWENGFTNIQLSGSEIIAGVKAYKSYVSSIKTDEYVNWVCNGMYNLRISSSESQSGLTGKDDDYFTKVFTYLGIDDDSPNWRVEKRSRRASGYVGPGPQCLLVRVTEDEDSAVNGSIIVEDDQLTLGSLICNIQHTAQQFAGFSNQEKQFDIYYGFGNYGTLVENGDRMIGSIIVFDGDVYNLPCELMTMYKTYHFNSIFDTIPSALVVNYVPLETKINTFFDYGMNYRNTHSPNVQVEPGEITGVSTQDRPQHQYNPIYSDNNVSNDVYNAQSDEWSELKFTQRIFYSQLKTNGEMIDNWSDFRALDYIDADTRYGKITHMLTNKDVLYFWLSKAFGKLSVNERSLITDNNSNTIQLGQGGVLQRTDYIDTKYGLRENDRSAISTSSGVFWIDILNKAILMSNGASVINYGEQLNVQNIINEKLDDSIPNISFDVQNDELLCKCLKDGSLLVFNTKVNCATSVYTRLYVDTIYNNNVLYGLTSDSKAIRYNYLSIGDNETYLSPTVLSFVVNQAPSVTKVFDNQLIVTLRQDYDADYAKSFMSGRTMLFETNMNSSKYDHESKEVITDRENNITYCIPRIDNSVYGNRLRGRWMKVTMTDDDPKYDYSISHILTKFRQSFN